MKQKELNLGDKTIVVGAKALFALNIAGAIVATEIEDKIYTVRQTYNRFKKSMAK
ncbi:hypothetical protein HOJ01_01210 [bacterium]|jgi:hypothetical protein|nr:hypothetical protein [bacterium]MBT6293408.1 hypothetical protein [bacterium]